MQGLRLQQVRLSKTSMATRHEPSPTRKPDAAAACCAFSVLPGNPWQPCPELLTQDEAVRYLRLDEIGTDDPAGALTYYRRKGLLRATQVGKCLRYRRIELERLLDRLTEMNPR